MGECTTASRRFGYLVAATINLFLLWLAPRIGDWDWLPLTDDYDDVVPWVVASLGATVAVNLTWVVHDPAWWRHLAQAALHAISVAVALQVWDVFPLDLARGWELLVRALIVLWLLGASIGAVTELLKAGGSRSHRRPATTLG